MPRRCEDVIVSIEKGSFVAVLGHNGSGKSTLAKHLNAVLLPCGGAVYVEGMDTARREQCCWRSGGGRAWCSRTRTTRSSPTWWRRMWPSRPENLGVPPAEIRRRVDDALAAVGMERVRPPRAAPALRRTEAARGHRGRHGHGAGVHRAGRGHGHAGPRGPAGGHRHRAAAQPGEGHHRGAHHPPHGRGARAPTGSSS